MRGKAWTIESIFRKHEILVRRLLQGLFIFGVYHWLSNGYFLVIELTRHLSRTTPSNPAWIDKVFSVGITIAILLCLTLAIFQLVSFFAITSGKRFVICLISLISFWTAFNPNAIVPTIGLVGFFLFVHLSRGQKSLSRNETGF